MTQPGHPLARASDVMEPSAAQLKKQVARLERQLREEVEKRKRLEETLSASEDHFQSLMNASADAIVLHDIRTGVVVDVNQKMLEMYGYGRKEELVGAFVGGLSSNEPPYTEVEAGRRPTPGNEGA